MVATVLAATAATLISATGQAGAALTFDGRAYERVSPSDTNGFPVAPVRVRSAAPSGERVLFQATRGAAPGTGVGVGGDVLRATRTSDGWTSASLYPDVPVDSQFFNDVPQLEAVSDDLTKSVVKSPSELTPDAPATGDDGRNLYIRDAVDVYHVLNPLNADGGVAYEASTPDMSHVVFSSFRPQVDNPGIIDKQAYEWAGGQVRLVSVLPGESLPGSSSSIGGAPGTVGLQHAISSDGTRVFFRVDAAANGSAGFGQVYARENGSSTVHVSASQATIPDPNGPLPALFLRAEAAHGHTALFSSCEKLTDDSTATSNLADPAGGLCSVSPYGTPEADKSDLYRYDFRSGVLTDLTTQDANGADFAGLIGASDDLDRIYFTARGDLADGATAGDVNVYLWDHGTTTFVGAGLPSPIEVSKDPLALQDADNWSMDASRHARTARVTPDGRYAVFTSRADLTAYDNSGPDCPLDDFSGGIGRQCTEIYRFDAVLDRLECLSCPAGGGASRGDSQLLSGVDFFNVNKNELPNNLLADGTTYFESPNKLVGADTNGTVDVYQHRNGQVGLISDGGNSAGARFADATTSGNDVFFTTSARLVAADRDPLVDLYDARVGGGFPDVLPVRPCADDECQGAIGARPPLRDPGSDLVRGDGNSASPLRGRYSVRRLSKAQRAAFARTGKVVLKLRTNAAGRISVVGRAANGGAIVARGNTKVTRAGSVGVTVKLTAAGRRTLARAGSLKLGLVVAHSKVGERKRLSIALERTRRPRADASSDPARRGGPTTNRKGS